MPICDEEEGGEGGEQTAALLFRCSLAVILTYRGEGITLLFRCSGAVILTHRRGGDTSLLYMMELSFTHTEERGHLFYDT